MLQFFFILFIFADIEDDLKAGELKHKKIKKECKSRIFIDRVSQPATQDNVNKN